MLLIGHPSGVTPARVKANHINEPPFARFEVLGFSSTSRRLISGTAYYPADTLDDVADQAPGPSGEAGPVAINEGL